MIGHPLPSSTAAGEAELQELLTRAQAGESLPGLELEGPRGAVVSLSVWVAPLSNEAGHLVEVWVGPRAGAPCRAG